MVLMVKRWYRSRRNGAIVAVVAMLGLLYYISLQLSLERVQDLDITRSVDVVSVARRVVLSEELPSAVKELANANVKSRSAIIESTPQISIPTKVMLVRYHLRLPGSKAAPESYIENKLQEALKQDKGMGCEIPQLDPFAKEVTQFSTKIPNIKCNGHDWVKCYHSKCKVQDSIKATYTDILCTYKDILYHSDQKYTIGPPQRVEGGDYELKESDHIKVSCVGRSRHDGKKAEWSGNTLGFRPISPAAPPPGREHSYNVVIFGFDSTARNGFIRHMPKTWQALKDIGATVMEGYNIVGDGTPAALFPILTGKTELELPDVRKSKHNNGSLDSFPFVFYKLKKDGYHTAYFEDMPNIGTFQYRFNGFRHQPADHYLRAFYLEEDKPYWKKKKNSYCVGDTPQFKMMINITQQFLNLDGKRFIFTFIADITHDDIMIRVADDDTSAFLRGLQEKAEDTLIIAMSDHGPRFAKVRDTLQGKLEERLPLMAVRLPSRFARARPGARRALEANAHALTTPHDVYATIMDVLDMKQHWNPYRVRGADFPRGLTMLEPIPRNRSCSEAGIEPHWCSCLNWRNVSRDDPFHGRPAAALVDYINSLVKEVGGLCIPRTLASTEWVLRQRANSRLLSFARARDPDGYVGDFNADTRAATENYQAKIVVGPGRGVFEASMTYIVKEDKFVINTRDISRTNAYRDEPSCISRTHPHLNPYCYCR